MQTKELYFKAYAKWGAMQYVVAMEEMSELQKAISKMLRNQIFHDNTGDCMENLIEEIADVEIMLEQLKYFTKTDDKVEEQKRFKLERLRKRIEGID